ncbi:MAG: hypothetical protein M9945_12540 [Aquamicrobium sp.]|uniref:hypothetical protein n=1 Tax=Aquamicrobium sp. TaxID=1872579 RepID=UPI00349EEAE6|nr:hypothetical protein [Aquamicrobium sp.]
MIDAGTISTTFAPLEQLLAERKSTHGEYRDHAAYTQAIKSLCRSSDNWSSLQDHQKETLEMIAHKIGRILAGDPNFDDHWRDISGYAKLTADRLAGVA